MPDNYARTDLDTPTGARRKKLFSFDGDAIGVGAERVARFLGTGSYLLWQTVFVIIWILLNLAFSTQAAYAAPLILLAQNRQDDRDRVSLNEDRRRTAETKADTEFLARELAGLRIAVGENVTRDYLRHELDDLTDLLHRIEDKLEDREHDDHDSQDGPSDRPR